MWICLNDAFLSIVALPLEADKPDFLSVRARVKGDLERVFGDVRVTHTPLADYAYRAEVFFGDVMDVIGARIQAIDYTNFKASVKEKDRHDAYLRCWVAMRDLQEKRLTKRKKKRLFTDRGLFDTRRGS